jgi:hypothetical protein
MPRNRVQHQKGLSDDPAAFPVCRLPANEDQPTLYLPIRAIQSGMLVPMRARIRPASSFAYAPMTAPPAWP